MSLLHYVVNKIFAVFMIEKADGNDYGNTVFVGTKKQENECE